MTPERLSEIQERLDAAWRYCPTPWRYDPHDRTVRAADNRILWDEDDHEDASGQMPSFLAHVPVDLNDLLAEVRHLRGMADDLREALAEEMSRGPEPPLTAEDYTAAQPLMQRLVDSGMFTRDEGGRLVPNASLWTCAAHEEGRLAGLETAARLAEKLAERYRGDRFAPLDYREGWRDALSACARDLRVTRKAQP